MEWYFFQHNNSSKNFKFNGSSELIFKSKKITKFKSNNYILYKENHILISDVRGNISVFSIKENKVIKKFNFYKKKYKDLDKSINFILDKNTIYVSDNIGYLYAYDVEKKKSFGQTILKFLLDLIWKLLKIKKYFLIKIIVYFL